MNVFHVHKDVKTVVLHILVPSVPLVTIHYSILQTIRQLAGKENVLVVTIQTIRLRLVLHAVKDARFVHHLVFVGHANLVGT